MPYTIDTLKKANAPSFNQLFVPIDRAKIGMPPLESRGDRPLKMTFDDQLKALIFFHLERITRPHNTFFRSLRKMILHVVSSPLKRESKKAVLQKPSIPEDLNSLRIYTKTCKPRLSASCQKNMMSLEIS